MSINMIPREGSNAFSGTVNTAFSFPALLADNLDDDLRSRGLESATELEENWAVSPSVGGPIVEDRIWFFATHSSRVADLVASGLFHAVDPSAFVYEPDLSRPGVDQATAREQSINLTIQATQKDKLKAYWSNSSTDRPRYLQGRALGALFVTPEAAVNNQVRTNVYQLNWVRPHTNRLLFEAGVSHLPFGYDLPHAEGRLPRRARNHGGGAAARVPQLLVVAVRDGRVHQPQERQLLHRVDVVRHRQPQPEGRRQLQPAAHLDERRERVLDAAHDHFAAIRSGRCSTPGWDRSTPRPASGSTPRSSGRSTA